MKIEKKSTIVKKIGVQMRNSSPFVECMCLFVFLGGIILILFTKASIHIFINQFHSPFFDVFFTQATFLGDGISAAILVVLLLFVRFRYAMMMALSNITCSVLVQLLKRFFFTESVRPYEFFKGIQNLYLIPGVEVYSFHSFPSGHSATIFTTCALLCLMTKRRLLRLLLFALALLVAFSRVYLSQHYFADIYAGAIMGVVAAFCTAAFFDKEISYAGEV